MRAIFGDKEIKGFFNNLKIKNSWTWKQLSKVSNVSEKTLRDWCGGKYTINLQIIKKFLEEVI